MEAQNPKTTKHSEELHQAASEYQPPTVDELSDEDLNGVVGGKKGSTSGTVRTTKPRLSRL